MNVLDFQNLQFLEPSAYDSDILPSLQEVSAQVKLGDIRASYFYLVPLSEIPILVVVPHRLVQSSKVGPRCVSKTSYTQAIE